MSPFLGTPGSTDKLIATSVTARTFKTVTVLLVLVITSRGPLELGLNKQLAYLIQAVCAVMIFVWLRKGSEVVLGSRGRSAWLALVLLILSCVASSIVTIITRPTLSVSVPIAYGLTIVMIGLFLYLGAAFEWRWKLQPIDGSGLFLLAGLQVGFGVAQQSLMWTTLPGGDLGTLGGALRPPGLTGSYLHYPLVLAVVVICGLGLWERSRDRMAILASLLGSFGIVWSFSRSGMLILGGTIALAIVTSNSFRLRLQVGVGALLITAWVLSSTASNIYADRIAGALSASSPGNAGRIDLWKWGLSRWLNGPILVGRETGLATNITKNVSGVDVGVVESSLVQQLVNLGLIGAVATYFMLWNSYRAIDRNASIVRSGSLACIVQTVVYQSVEVLPFMVLVSLLPILFGKQVSTADSVRSVSQRLDTENA